MEKKKYHCLLACKRKYNRKEAKQHQQMAQDKASIKLYIYKCPDCRYYHLTKQGQYKDFGNDVII